jgi:hypothetical protein
MKYRVEVFGEEDGDPTVYYVEADSAADAGTIAFLLDGGWGGGESTPSSASALRALSAEYTVAIKSP